MFRIADIDFQNQNAYLDAYVDEQELVFGIHIQGSSKNNQFKDWKPHVESDALLRFKPGELKTWSDIAGRTIQWQDAHDSDQEPYAFLYVFEHEPIYQSKVMFENIHGEVFVKWNALCDVGFDEKYGVQLPLNIESSVSFAGILFGDKPEEQCKKLIEPYLQPHHFQFIKNKYNVSLLVPIDDELSTNCLVLGDY